MANLEILPKSGPSLGIHLDGDTYVPGDTITGHVFRTTHVVSPDSSLNICMFGTARTDRIWRDENAFEQGFKLHHHSEIIFQGPLHIENGGCEQKWPFTIPIPRHTDSELNKGLENLSCTPLEDHELPPSYALRETPGDPRVACIEYVVEAKLTVNGHGRTEVFDARRPFKIIHLTPDPPIADFKLRRCRYPRSVSAQRLIPGMENVKLSFSQKIKHNFSFSKDPKLTFDLFVDVPQVIQLDNPTPIPFKLLVAPDWEKTSAIIQNVTQQVKLTSVHIWIVTETNFIDRDGLQGGKSTEVDLGIVQALNRLKKNVRIPFTSQWEPIDIGKMANLRIGLQDTGFPQEWSFSQTEFTHTFLTYNMQVTHRLKWTVQGEIVGVRFNVAGESDLLILRPSGEREPQGSRDAESHEEESGQQIPRDESCIRPPAEEAEPPSFTDTQRVD